MRDAVTLAGLAASVDAILGPAADGGETTTIALPAGRPVTRVALGLDPSDALHALVHGGGVDAVLLHRTGRLDHDTWPTGVGLLLNHAPFDERLGLGVNPWLARLLSPGTLQAFGGHRGVHLAMRLPLDPAPSFTALEARLRALFGGVETVVPPTDGAAVAQVVTARAMTDALVREAAGGGATAYVTGQWRMPGERAVRDTGIGVIAVGHRRSEAWSLGLLRDLLRERHPSITITLT